MTTQRGPAIGTEIGHYRIEAVLGRGGMGVVYRAIDRRLERNVALKVLPPGYAEDRLFRARFLRESRVAASIDHPGVIPIYEAGEEDGQLFIAMRHVDGTDLAQLLRREGPLEPDRALALAGQLAAALDAAHARGLVHRDVKPSNALVARQGDSEHVYLSDFGLSRQAGGDATLSEAGAIAGTVRYMAPEVIRSGRADTRSDLYSLGCVLFECLTGEPPFPGPSEAAVIYGHLEEPPPRVSARRAGLPRALDDVLARALHKDPERRWASGAEMMRAVRTALGGTSPGGALRGRMRRRAVIAAVGFGALGAAAIVAAVVGSSDGPDLASVKPGGVAVIDPREASLSGQVALEGAPAAIAAGAGAVWVTDEERRLVSRIDVQTRTIRQTISVGHGPSAVAVDRDRVWVSNRQDGTLSVISAGTNQVIDTIRVGRSADGLCVGQGSVWVASPLDYAVVRLDAESGRRTATVTLDTQPERLACGRDAVWASSSSSGTITEISPAAAVAARTVQVNRGASALGLAAGALWVANASDGTVSRIDPARAAVTATIPLGAADGPADLAATSDAIWVTSEFGGTVARIDPDSARVVEKLNVGNRLQGLAVVDGALWVGVADAGARHRGGTLRVEVLGEPRWKEFDPALGYGLGFLGLTNDGLTGYRRRGGAGGATLVANLAEALPAPSDGGRTYAFRLRPGIVYSNGDPLLAGHVRFSLERAVRQGQIAAGLFSTIRGAARCTPKRCDLSRGIVTDDEARTVVFRLTEPDGDLPYKLAVPFASVLPPSTGHSAPARRALPATGPYRIAEFRRGRLLRLERNPRFRSWSAAVRPDGYPDAIHASFGADGRAAVERVLKGRVDLLTGLPLLLPTELERAGLRAPEQLRQSAAPFTVYWVLNTRVAPFDRLAARRAVAFALDRRAAVAAAGGRQFARETCQFLPPGFLGSRPYCPYVRGGSAGAAGPPDLARARRLVERSGTEGMRVAVHLPVDLAPRLGRVILRALRSIGYDASLRPLPVDQHFATVFDTSKRSQIGLMPWLADYPAPSTFLNNFSCSAIVRNSPGNLNPSQFCDRQVDRLMGRALRTQAVDPQAADRLWAQAERRIVDQAPAVAMYNPLNVDLVSERVANYQHGPLTGALYDQLWVR